MRKNSPHLGIAELWAVVVLVLATNSGAQSRELTLRPTIYWTEHLARTVKGHPVFGLAIADSTRHRVTTKSSVQSTTRENEPASIPRKIVTRFITWITARTGWLEKRPPAIRLVPPEQLNKMYYDTDSESHGVTVRALFDKMTDTIYLPSAWNADDLRDRSYLLHELVHHLQIMNKVEAACYDAYNVRAYELQFDWLKKQGIQNPQSFLNIGPIVLFMSEMCPLFRGCEFQLEGCQ